MLQSMTIRCDQCGYDNQENYRFCGMCGALLHAPSTKPEEAQESPAQTVPRSTAPPVSGPSFLGLGEERPKENVHYLLEDEEAESGHRRMYVALFLLLIAGGVLGWRWRHEAYAWWAKQAGSPAVTSAPVTTATGTPTVGNGGLSTAPAPSQPLAPTNSAAQNQGPPPPLPSSDEAHMTSSDAAQGGEQVKVPSQNMGADLLQSAPASSGSNAGKTQPKEETSSSDETALDGTAAAPTPRRKSKTQNTLVSKPSSSAEDKLVSDAEKYLYGNGAPQDCGRAQKNLQTAATRSSAKAMSVLGTMYATGHCVNRDLPNAYRWFAKALHQEPGNGRVQQDLEVLWRQMSPEERQIAARSE